MTAVRRLAEARSGRRRRGRRGGRGRWLLRDRWLLRYLPRWHVLRWGCLLR
ncbi:hypothetical protein IHE61_09090 [Streptomyces sp. GKU 257-1]|nr:hypothetical protein [Streptomyces sp. GKU 257-1]